MSPTYRNDSEVQSYIVLGIDNTFKTVIPGASVETYDPDVPSDFTQTDSSPTINLAIVSGEGASWTDAFYPDGDFSVSIRPSGAVEFAGTVTLLRSLDDFASEGVMKTWGGGAEEVLSDPNPKASYKIGVEDTALFQGAVVVQLSK